MYFTFVDLRPYDKRGPTPIDSGHRKKRPRLRYRRWTNDTSRDDYSTAACGVLLLVFCGVTSFPVPGHRRDETGENEHERALLN